MVTKLEGDIIERVIKARTEAKLERSDLADALALDDNSYGHYERERFAFTVEQLFIISRIVGRSVAWLLGLPTDLTEDQQELLHLYRELPDAQHRKQALETLRLQWRFKDSG